MRRTYVAFYVAPGLLKTPSELRKNTAAISLRMETSPQMREKVAPFLTSTRHDPPDPTGPGLVVLLPPSSVTSSAQRYLIGTRQALGPRDEGLRWGRSPCPMLFAILSLVVVFRLTGWELAEAHG